jgi:hypothetical protein
MIIEHLWKKLSKSRSGRFLAAFLIGGSFGLSAGASQSHEVFVLILATVGGAVIALVAVAILEAIDSERAGKSHGRSQRRRIPPHHTSPRVDVKPPALPFGQSSPTPPSRPDS